MAHYAIGDIHACLSSLKTLLGKLEFDPSRDTLWFTGDLVGRGPEPAETLRFLSGLGSAVEAVLGNHDIHCLAVAAGTGRRQRRDGLDSLLEAPDREPLLEWLRHRPLMTRPAVGDWALVHAGVPPNWSLSDAWQLAGELESRLRGPDWPTLLANLYGNRPDRWSPSLTGWDRWRYVINAFTRMRYCAADGQLLFDYKGPPEEAPSDHWPWYEARRLNGLTEDNTQVIAGHWSRLGRRTGPGYIMLDTGCLWGGQLTALHLDEPLPRFTTVACSARQTPG